MDEPELGQRGLDVLLLLLQCGHGGLGALDDELELLAPTLASSPELAGQTGLYFQDGRKTPSSAASRDKAARDALWAESCRLLGLTW